MKVTTTPYFTPTAKMFTQGTSAAKKDMELDQPPEDSISKVAFAPNSNYLVASSWDNNVRSMKCIYLVHTRS